MQKEKGLRTKIFQVAFRKNSENIFSFPKINAGSENMSRSWGFKFGDSQNSIWNPCLGESFFEFRMIFHLNSVTPTQDMKHEIQKHLGFLLLAWYSLQGHQGWAVTYLANAEDWDFGSSELEVCGKIGTDSCGVGKRLVRPWNCLGTACFSVRKAGAQKQLRLGWQNQVKVFCSILMCLNMEFLRCS